LESELIVHARNGDHAAYETLVREHEAAVFRLAYLILSDADAAQDVAQEAFVRAFQQLDRFDPARPFRPWVLRITRNLARNHRRSLGRYVAALQRAGWAAPRSSASAEAEQLGAQETQALWDAVRRLSRQEQEVIYLRYMLELSVNETAEVLDVPAGTVKSRLSRALRRLKGVVLHEFPLLVEGRLP